MLAKSLNIASFAVVIMSLLSSCTKDDCYDVDYMPGLWLVEESEPAVTPIYYRLEKGDTVRITKNISTSNEWWVYGPIYERGPLGYSDVYHCFIKEDGYFKWSKEGTRTVTCSLVKLNKKHFVFDELRNNRRFKMKRLKE